LISIPYSLSLDRFHSVLQIVMGWGDQEPHVFASEDLIAGNPNEIADLDAEDESLLILDELLPFVGAEALYLYDFAKEWRHRLRLVDLKTGPHESVLLKGNGNCPIEANASRALPGEGKKGTGAKSANTGKGKKRLAAAKNNPKMRAGSLDLPRINEELAQLTNRWRRKTRLTKKSGRSGVSKPILDRGMILLDTASIRDCYLKDLQSVRDRVLAAEDELARHESDDVPEFRRCVNLEFGARFSVMRELQQGIDWMTARLALVQKLMQHGIRPVGKAYLQALQIEAGEAPYPDFPPQREEIPPEAPDLEDIFDRETIRNFISGTGDDFLTDEEVDSLTEDVLQEAGKRDLVAECKSLYRKIVTLLHPDRAGEMTAERKNLWLRAQDAYADGDVLSLRSILDRCDAGTRDRYLTCSEIIDAIAQASVQLQAIEMFREREATEPSWDFCRLNEKKRKGRLRRVTKDLDDEEDNLRVQLAELQRECQSLEEEAKNWKSKRADGSMQLDLFR